jgi:HlyD family secretion protein
VAESNEIVQRAAIDRAKATLRKARLEYERAVLLRQKGTLSASEYDTVLVAFEVAKTDLTMAEAQLQNALAAREQSKAALESAQIDLERTKIRSPIDGVVIERAVDQGQTVAASLSSPVLFRIAHDLREIQIEANVDEADIGNVRKGNAVSFVVDAFPDSEFSGVVSQVRLASVELNGVVTYTVIITADNPGLRLLPGMTAIVEIITGTREDTLRAPNDALRFKPPPDSELALMVAEGPGGAPVSEGEAGGAGGGGVLRGLNQMAVDLGLDEDQGSVLERGIKDVMAKMRPLLQAGTGSDDETEALREQMHRMIDEVFRTNLTPDQFQVPEMRKQCNLCPQGSYGQGRKRRHQTGQSRLGISGSSSPRFPAAASRGNRGGDEHAPAAKLNASRVGLKA